MEDIAIYIAAFSFLIYFNCDTIGGGGFCFFIKN
jgi:hypothetical protein